MCWLSGCADLVQFVTANLLSSLEARFGIRLNPNFEPRINEIQAFSKDALAGTQDRQG